MSGEASAVSQPWSCAIRCAFDGHPDVDRQAHGHTAADAAALARYMAERIATVGIWVGPDVLLPAHRITAITLADPVNAEAKATPLRKTT